MHVWELLTFLGTCLLLFLPGASLWRVLFPQQSVFEQCTWGSIFGLAMAVYLAFVLGYWHISFFWIAWSCLSACLVLLAVHHSKRRRIAAPLGGVSRWALLILALVAFSRFAPTVIREWPPGWDPTFHLILAKKILLADGMIYDWTPFENVPLNYPLGSHFLVVIVSNLSHLPLHRAFQMLIPLVGALTTAATYLLCRQVFAREEIAVLAATAYGFWAGYGSIDYYRWGGLPNALAMMFLLPLIHLLLVPASTWKHRGIFSLFFAAICLTHHHAMVTSGIVLAALALYFLLVHRKLEANTILSGVAGGVVLGVFFLPRYLLRAASLGSTDVFHFQEGPFTPGAVANDLGIVLVVCGVWGIVMAWNAYRDCDGVKVLLLISSILLALFLCCGPIYRFFSLRFTGQDFVAFTPSRFLTDLTSVLSIFAGYGAFWLWRRSRLPFGGAMILALVLGTSNYWLWRDIFLDAGPPRDSWPAYRWISEHTPPGSIVLNADPWAAYGSWRRTLASPLPISEPRHLARDEDPVWTTLPSGALPDQALPNELVKVVPPGSKGKVIWRDNNGWAVIEVAPGGTAHR